MYIWFFFISQFRNCFCLVNRFCRLVCTCMSLYKSQHKRQQQKSMNSKQLTKLFRFLRAFFLFLSLFLCCIGNPVFVVVLLGTLRIFLCRFYFQKQNTHTHTHIHIYLRIYAILFCGSCNLFVFVFCLWKIQKKCVCLHFFTPGRCVVANIFRKIAICHTKKENTQKHSTQTQKQNKTKQNITHK